MNEPTREQLEADCAKMREALEKWQHVWKETESEWDDCDAASKQAEEALSTDSGSALLEEVRRLRENSDRLAAALEKWQVWREAPEWGALNGLYEQGEEALAALRKGGVA